MDSTTPYRHDGLNINALILSAILYYALPRVRGWLMICTWPEYEATCWN
mgnify:CR=1 FL=1